MVRTPHLSLSEGIWRGPCTEDKFSAHTKGMGVEPILIRYSFPLNRQIFQKVRIN